MLPLIMWLALAAVPQSGQGFLNRDFTDVVKTEFFTAFRLAEVRRRFSGEFEHVVLEPAAPLREHVRMMIRLNGEGETRIIDVTIDRGFIDGETSTAARDFVRRFLSAGIPKGDDPAIDTLVKELSGGPIEKGSRAYEVFAGRQETITVGGKRTRLTLSNGGQGAARLLRLSLHRAPANPG